MDPMDNKQPTVAVLMSTYNGEKYLSEQLDSIFNQKGVSVRLYIRDDGSTDRTLEIVGTYSKNYPIEVFTDGENVRPGESFMRLVYRYADVPEIDFYAFSDQDDIWLEDKMITAISAIEKCDAQEPVLYSSNQYLFIDEENKGPRYSDPQRTDLISHITRNTIAGCTFVFNKELALLVSKTDRPDARIIKYRLHDSWMMLVAIVSGQVIYDEQAYMLYRIHNSNTVGIKEQSLAKRLKKLKRFYSKQEDANIRMLTAQELLRLFPNMTLDKQQILTLYSDYQKNWKCKKSLAFNKFIKANCSENSMLFTLKVLVNFV